MVLWFRPGPGASLRLGVVASKRIFPRAVDRARAKRLLREAYRLNRTRLHGKYDVVLVARRAILDAASGAIGRELLNLSRDAGARRPETK
jgi:ribonuclease P protein component